MGHGGEGDHAHHRRLEGEPNPFRRRHADTNAGERAGSHADRKQLDARWLPARRSEYLVDHPEKALRVGRLAVVLRGGDDLTVLHRCHHPPAGCRIHG